MCEPTRSRRTRRGLIRGALVTAAALLASVIPLAAQTASTTPAKLNPIQQENRKPGSLDWQLTRVRLDKRDGFRSPWVEGYCSQQSVQAGDTLQLMVSTTPPARFKI